MTEPIKIIDTQKYYYSQDGQLEVLNNRIDDLTHKLNEVIEVLNSLTNQGETK